jgi:hypothetical protein
MFARNLHAATPFHGAGAAYAGSSRPPSPAAWPRSPHVAAPLLETMPARELRISPKLQMSSPKSTRGTPSQARGLVSPGANSSPMRRGSFAQSYHTADRSSGTVAQPCFAELRPACCVWQCRHFGLAGAGPSQILPVDPLLRVRGSQRPVIDRRVMQRANERSCRCLFARQLINQSMTATC